MSDSIDIIDSLSNTEDLIEHIKNYISLNQNTHVQKILSSLHHADLATLLDHSPYEIQNTLITLLKDTIRPETLVWLSSNAKHVLAEQIGIVETANLINALDVEDAIKVLDDFSDRIKSDIIENLSEPNNKDIIEGFNFPDDSVGRVMEKKFVVFAHHWTVQQAKSVLINKYNAIEDLHAAIIVDKDYKPIGNILIANLCRYSENHLIKDIMNQECKIATTDTKTDDLIYVFKQYALNIVPVINKSGKLIGVVSINSIVYIIDEKAEEDIMYLSAVGQQDVFSSVFKIVHSRFPWLFINLLTACISSIIINQFNATISKFIAVASIMPIIASMSGNAGTQAMTITVRALTNKDIDTSNVSKSIFKELMVCCFNGFLLSCIGSIIIYLLFDNIALTIIFSIAVTINILLAGFFGTSIPILLQMINIDPAAASVVLLTALTDSFSFFSFLGLIYVSLY